MVKPSLEESLRSLFDAERTVRRLHDELVAADRGALVTLLERAIGDANAQPEDEAALRLVRVAGLLGEMTGERAVDRLIDVLASQSAEARLAAGEALTELAFDRFKEVALGVERALDRLAPDSPALPELPFLLVEVPEPGVTKLLEAFFAHANGEVVAAAIEAATVLGDPAVVKSLAKLVDDARVVELEDEAGERDRTTVGALAGEAREILSGDD